MSWHALGDNPDVWQKARDVSKQILYHDGHDVSIEEQVTEAAKNQSMHNTAVALLKAQFSYFADGDHGKRQRFSSPRFHNGVEKHDQRIDVSTSALVAQRTRLNTISSNIANMSTLRNETGKTSLISHACDFSDG